MMRISEAWLREWCDNSLDTSAIINTLTMAGLEIDGVEAVSSVFSGVVIGHVRQVFAHPNADRLQICHVQVHPQSEDFVTIVCGAPNVAVGQRVAVALPGALLPNDFAITARTVRQVESHGMLCSQVELGLVQSNEGIWELPSDAPIGQDLRVYMQYDDKVLLGDFTPNRGDCLSVRGLARELSALCSLSLKTWNVDTVVVSSQNQVSVDIQAPQACWHYFGRVIENIDPQLQTPLWMVEKLSRAGLRAVNPVVDITNYVLLELGQPLHAYDLQQLQGELRVRMARVDESLLLLDEREVKLKATSLVIADDAGAIALAGVMGGHTTRVTQASTRIFLECACFAPRAIAGQARLYGLQTDAAHRFERGVDIEGQLLALEYATHLLIQLVGGQAGPITQKHSSSLSTIEEAQRPNIVLSEERLQQVLGFDFPSAEIEPILIRLGCLVVEKGTVNEGTVNEGATWLITPPSYRFDIQRDVDLIEELVRVYGYDKVPSRVPLLTLQPPQGEQWHATQSLRQAQSLLVALGYSEVMTYSFVDPQLQGALSIDMDRVVNVINPISADLSQMRTNLWVGLLKTVERNQKRQVESIKLFESGLTFLRASESTLLPIQSLKIAGVWAGDQTPLRWQNKPQPVDFFAIKADVERLLLDFAIAEVEWRKAEHPALHPGQSAQLMVNGSVLGWLGRVHPSALKAVDLQGNIYIFELDFDLLAVDKAQELSKPFVEASRFPEIRRDLAICVANTISSAQVMSSIREAKVAFLRDLKLFDVYQGPGVVDGHKSLALTLSFQHHERTLTELEAETSMTSIRQHLIAKLKATLRE